MGIPVVVPSGKLEVRKDESGSVCRKARPLPAGLEIRMFATKKGSLATTAV